MAEYSKEEALAEIQRRQKEKQTQQQSEFSYRRALEAFTTGAGSMGLTSSEQQFPGYERFFRAGEGAGPGAVGGAAVGGPLGALVGGTAGMFGNIAAKEMFPSSPTAQALFQLAIPSGQTAIRMRGQSVPSTWTAAETQPPVVSKETGIPMTYGQQTGDVSELFKEAQVAKTLRGAPIADAFKVAQAQSADEFFTNLQKFQSNPNLNEKEITKGIFDAFDAFEKKVLTTFKAENAKNFNTVKKIAGNSTIIPTNNVQTTIDALIRSYDNPEVLGMSNVASQLKTIKRELTTTTKTGGLLVDQKGVPITPEQVSVTPNNISIERLQQNLSAWGDAAYKGTYEGLADAAPGQVKGIARKILGAFKADLDEAAQSGVKGAQELQNARTAFANNLKKIQEIEDKKIFQYFNKTSAESLEPEAVVKKFITLSPSQKAEVAAVLGNARPDIWDSLRLQGLNQILSKARVGETVAAGSPKFDLRTALKDLGKLDDADTQWLFPTKAEKNDFRAGLLSLQKIQKQANLFDPTVGRLREAEQAAEQVAGAVGGATKKYGTQAFISSLRFLVGTADEQKLAAMMFNPNGRVLLRELSKDKPNINAMGKAFESVSAGLLGSTVTAKEVPTAMELQQPQQEYTIEEAKAEALRRGLTIE
jgi:hypothetical protein